MSAFPDVFTGLLNSSRVGVMDGGFATFMEDELGLDMPSPLWSATLLDPNHRQGQHKGHDAVRAAHAAFIKSGSRIVETASYQASVPSFARSQPPNPVYPPSVAEHLMRESIRLAVQAADSAHADGAPDAIIALSLGPYGAMLEGGRECMYTGPRARAMLTDPGVRHRPVCACRQNRRPKCRGSGARRHPQIPHRPSYGLVGRRAALVSPGASGL